MSLLEVRGVSKRFGGVQALSGVDLSLEPGRIVGLIGPNGAGKTTLFNVIAGACPPDEGRVVFDGRDVTRLPAHRVCRLGLARTWQITRPFAGLTCLENVEVGFVGRGGRQDKPRRREEGMEILKLCGLAGQERRPAGSLNLIDKKRLELARALATGPRLILLDEVLGGLSSLEMDQALDLIRSIRDRMKVTVLWIEHVMGAIMSLSELVLVLDQGRLICQGSPPEVACHPRVVAAYLGEQNA